MPSPANAIKFNVSKYILFITAYQSYRYCVKYYEYFKHLTLSEELFEVLFTFFNLLFL